MTKSIKYTLSMERELTRKTTDYSLNLLARYHASWTPKIEVKSKIMIKQFSKIKNQNQSSIDLMRVLFYLPLAALNKFIFFLPFFKADNTVLVTGHDSENEL